MYRHIVDYTYLNVVSANLALHPDFPLVHLDQPLNMLNDVVYEFQLKHLSMNR